MNYRILDLTTNTFVSEGLALTPDGKVISIGGVVPEQHMIQQGINFDGITTHELYEGDAISIPIADDAFMQKHMKNLVKYTGANFIPETFDEIIIQIVSDTDGIPYYWLMFKNKGVHILNKDITDSNFSLGDMDDMDSEVRAIPMGDITGIAKLIMNRPLDIVYNCTDPQWIKPM